MQALFLGGVFAKVNEEEVISNSKSSVEYSANIFQERLISGLKKNGISLHVVSAPFIGAFPKYYKKAYFNGFEHQQDEYEYVRFNNVWGIRNISRTKAIKKAIRQYISFASDKKLIIVYSAHTPFIEAAVYAKRKDRDIKICLVVPDLPQYMNLNKEKSNIYDFLKKLDIYHMNGLMENVDSFVLLTEQMKDVLHVKNRPYMIVEGIIDDEDEKKPVESIEKKQNEKYVVYAGKINQRFGVIDLTDAFRLIKDKEYRLIFCGKGDALDYVLDASRVDSRIIYKGQLPVSEVRACIQMANVLVNPRLNNEEYTKYSFPSKNIEYLLSGNPVVAYMLDGMKEIYKDFLYVPRGSKPDELAECICEACLEEEKEARKKKFDAYKLSLYKQNVCAEMLKMIYEGENVGNY